MKLKQLIHTITLSLVCLQVVIAQEVDQNYIDSLLLSVKNQPEEAVLKTYSKFYRKTRELPLEQALAHFEYALEKEQNDYGKILLLDGITRFMGTKDLDEESLTLTTKGLALAEKISNPEYQIIFNTRLGSIYHQATRYRDAMQFLNKAQLLIEEGEDLRYLLNVYTLKGNVFESIENQSEAEAYYLKAWKLIDSQDNHPDRGFYLFFLADYFSRMGKAVEMAQFTEAYSSYKLNKDPEAPPGHFPIQGIFSTSNNIENTSKLEEVMRVSDSLHTFKSMVYSAYVLSKIYSSEGKHDKAIEVLNTVRDNLKIQGKDELLMTVYQKLSSTYEMAGNYEDALLYKNLESELRDQIISDKMLGNIMELEVKYDSENKARQLEKKEANQKLLYWILASIGIILILVLFFFQKNRKKNRELASQKVLLEKTVGEKNVLLKETHHRVKNSFQMVSSLLYLQGENVEDEEAKAAIKEAENRVRSMVLIHHKLYNKDQLVGIDTKEYIEDLTKDIFASHFDQTQHLEYALELESIILNVDTITPLGLILNELIINVFKHAFDQDATGLLKIEFQKKYESLLLTVTDNGNGFSEEKKEYSFGLKLIRALARKFEGQFKIHSTVGKGTTATLQINDFEIVPT